MFFSGFIILDLLAKAELGEDKCKGMPDKISNICKAVDRFISYAVKPLALEVVNSDLANVLKTYTNTIFKRPRTKNYKLLQI